MLFNGQDNPLNCPTPSNTRFLGPIKSPHRFSRFCRARKCNQQTDRQTDHNIPSVAIGHI